MQMQQEHDFLSTSEAAKILERTPDSIRSLARSGKLPAIRTGAGRLFRRGDVEKLAEERRLRHAAESMRE
ncbi:MAG: helix-turn-helix domain-containing protein [Acidobacteria bacterium]|nr:helix-turn-helix domain-containing protein [Acidobacteriota bacterium]